MSHCASFGELQFGNQPVKPEDPKEESGVEESESGADHPQRSNASSKLTAAPDGAKLLSSLRCITDGLDISVLLTPADCPELQTSFWQVNTPSSPSLAQEQRGSSPWSISMASFALIQQLHMLLMLEAPDLDMVFQVESHKSRRDLTTMSVL
ncbi:hypothetical protein WISP_55198 [Willisornis vidua]|uniref:Uncharacterized protein n=1 Tax=Willisornis vidua TaxID=1566151 RepID=A0ABQ9DIM4_9PASS|nr:hypothetical protein WISP_55198 [Willisornis vidua]